VRGRVVKAYLMHIQKNLGTDEVVPGKRPAEPYYVDNHEQIDCKRGKLIKLLHTADWQIGKCYGQFEPDEAALLAEARFNTVERLAGAGA